MGNRLAVDASRNRGILLSFPYCKHADAAALEVAHYMPTSFPLITLFSSNIHRTCAESWKFIAECSEIDECDGISIFCCEFFERLSQHDSNGQFDDVFSRHRKERNELAMKIGKLTKLINFLLVIDENSSKTVRKIKSLGKSHARMGIRPWQYSIFIENLLLTISSRLRTKASHHVMYAWVHLFGFVLKIMLPYAISGLVDPDEMHIKVYSKSSKLDYKSKDRVSTQAVTSPVTTPLFHEKKLCLDPNQSIVHNRDGTPHRHENNIDNNNNNNNNNGDNNDSIQDDVQIDLQSKQSSSRLISSPTLQKQKPSGMKNKRNSLNKKIIHSDINLDDNMVKNFEDDKESESVQTNNNNSNNYDNNINNNKAKNLKKGLKNDNLANKNKKNPIENNSNNNDNKNKSFTSLIKTSHVTAHRFMRIRSNNNSTNKSDKYLESFSELSEQSHSSHCSNHNEKT